MDTPPNQGSADESLPEDLQHTLQEGETLIQALKDNRARLTAQGEDVDGMIRKVRAQMKHLVESQRECEKADEHLLQSTADLADAERNLFKFLAPIIDAKHAEQPFDPKLQEMKEQIDEWRKHMPKEE